MPGKLIPFAKIDDDAVRRIVQGFCCAQSISEIAAAANVSEKTCRSLVLALRPRLLREPFDLWRGALFWRTSLDPTTELFAQAAVFGCLASCYFDRTCYTNFQQGRRKSRLCKACAVTALEMGEDFTMSALRQNDRIHDFYAMLGLGPERGVGKLTLFRLRLAHMQVVTGAFEATRKRRDGTPDSRQRGERTVRGLFERLILDLERDPLIRAIPESDPRLAEYEDLTFLQ